MRLIDDEKIELIKVDNPKRHKREQGWNEAIDYVKKVLDSQPTVRTDKPAFWRENIRSISCSECKFKIRLGDASKMDMERIKSSFVFCPKCGRPMEREVVANAKAGNTL